MEIGLPNELGRREILKIHTALMKQHGKLGDDVALDVSHLCILLTILLLTTFAGGDFNFLHDNI